MGVRPDLVAAGEGYRWGEGDESDTPVRTGRTRAWRILRRNPVFWLGAVLGSSLVAIAVAGPFVLVHDPMEQFRDVLPLTGEAAPPSADFPLGTDVQGRDYLSRLVHAARTSLGIALAANAIATVVGLAVGALAALAPRPRLRLWGGVTVPIPVESLLMRFTDLWLAFPVLLLAIAMAYVLGASATLVAVLIGGTLWTVTARLVYGRVRLLLTASFVEAARALGAGPGRILVRHLLPHVVPLLVVIASLGVANAVLFEATLSFLGAGVPPPDPTWGTMVADHLSWFVTDPRLVVLPSLAIMATVLAFNLLGDALRDALDPRSWDP